MASVLVKDKDGLTLYCIAYDSYGVLKFSYVHADMASTARYHFIKTIPRSERRNVKVINVAPAVGFYAKDDNGDCISA